MGAMAGQYVSSSICNLLIHWKQLGKLNFLPILDYNIMQLIGRSHTTFAQSIYRACYKYSSNKDCIQPIYYIIST